MDNRKGLLGRRTEKRHIEEREREGKREKIERERERERESKRELGTRRDEISNKLVKCLIKVYGDEDIGDDSDMSHTGF